MIDLNPNHLATVERILTEHVPECEVRAFGSRATWTSKDYSDLDLAIVGSGPLDRRTLGRLKETFEDSDLPIRVDVLDWHSISESFRKVIERDYTVVQKGMQLGEVDEATHWRRVALADLIDLQLSSVDKKSKANEQAVQLCNYTDVYNNSFIHAGMDFMSATATEREIVRCSLVAGDVIITKDFEKHDDIGVPALVREDIPNLVCGYHLAILRSRVSVADGAYLFYALSTDQAQEQFHSYSNGITRFGLRKSDIGLVEIPLPPLPEQRAIAHVLGTLDEKIELNRRMNETLEAMARALFKSWFVDFEPVRAKMEGRWRRGESLPGLPADHYDLFPDRLVPSELGDIPEGWEVKPLGDVIEILDSRRVPLNSRQRAKRQGPYPYYGAAGIMDYVDDFLFDGIYVLVGEDGSVVDSDGHPVAQYVWGKFWANNHAHVLTGRAGISEQHLYLLLQQVIIMPFVTGAVQPKLSQRNLKAVRAVFPGEPGCRAFSSLVRPLFERMRDNAGEAEALVAKRHALLPKLLSGEVRIE